MARAGASRRARERDYLIDFWIDQHLSFWRTSGSFVSGFNIVVFLNPRFSNLVGDFTAMDPLRFENYVFKFK